MRHTRAPLASALCALALLILSALPAASDASPRAAHAPHAARTACLAKWSPTHPRRAPARTGGQIRHQSRSRRACRAHARSSHSQHVTRPLPAHTPPVALAGTAPSLAASPQAAAAASRSAVIAQVLAAPCANTEVTPEAGNLGIVRAAVLCLINRERAQNGDAPLKASPDLEAAAEEHSQELVADDYFAHVSPSGVTPVQRIRSTGYIPSPDDGYVIGENLAWGTYDLSTPQAIVAAWIASPEHLANILEAQYVETGIGVMPAVPAALAEGAPGATYAQEFGVIIP